MLKDKQLSIPNKIINKPQPKNSTNSSSKIQPNSNSTEYQKKARDYVSKSIRKDLPGKTEAEYKRLENQIINKASRLEYTDSSWYKARRAGKTKEQWLYSEVKAVEKTYAKKKNNPPKFNSTYEERLKQCPLKNCESSKGYWEGVQGESKYKPKDIPENQEIIKKLAEKGLDGIEYKDGIPDFFFASDAEVEIPNMVSHLGDVKNELGTKNQARIALAAKWNYDNKDSRMDWTYGDVQDWTRANNLNVHEDYDGESVYFIDNDIHHFFTHSGGRAEAAKGGFDE